MPKRKKLNKARKRRNGINIRFPITRTRSTFETIQSQLDGKDRNYLLDRLEELRSTLKQSKRRLKPSYPPSKILEEIRFFQHLYPYLFGNSDDFSDSISDDELRLAIALTETAMRSDTAMEVKSAEQQNKHRFTGRQKPRAYKSFHEH